MSSPAAPPGREKECAVCRRPPDAGLVSANLNIPGFLGAEDARRVLTTNTLFLSNVRRAVEQETTLLNYLHLRCLKLLAKHGDVPRPVDSVLREFAASSQGLASVLDDFVASPQGCVALSALKTSRGRLRVEGCEALATIETEVSRGELARVCIERSCAAELQLKPGEGSLDLEARECHSLFRLRLPELRKPSGSLAIRPYKCPALRELSLPQLSSAGGLCVYLSAGVSDTNALAAFGASMLAKVTGDVKMNFIHCRGLAEIRLPGLTEVGGLELGFRGCLVLSTVELPALHTLTQSLWLGFWDCQQLTGLALPALREVEGKEDPPGGPHFQASADLPVRTFAALKRNAQGTGGIQSTLHFESCARLRTCTFAALEHVGSGLQVTISDCAVLERLELPRLKRVAGAFELRLRDCPALETCEFPPETELQGTLYALAQRCGKLRSLGLPLLQRVASGPTEQKRGAHVVVNDCQSFTRLVLPASLPNYTDFKLTVHKCPSLLELVLPAMPDVVDLTVQVVNCTSLAGLTLSSDLPRCQKLVLTLVGCPRLERRRLGVPACEPGAVAITITNCRQLAAASLQLSSLRNLRSGLGEPPASLRR
eukprot:g21972.t1